VTVLQSGDGAVGCFVAIIFVLIVAGASAGLKYLLSTLETPEDRAGKMESSAYRLQKQAEERARQGVTDLLNNKPHSAQALSDQARRDLERAQELRRDAEAERTKKK
jgi:hypothetical protein